MNLSTALSGTYEIDEKISNVSSLVKRIEVAENEEKDKLIEQAADLILFIMNKQPQNPEVHFYAGEICKKQENLNQACKYYKNAISYKPGFVEAWVELGRVHVIQEDFFAAISNLQQAIKLQPDNIDANISLSECYLRVSKFQEAMDILERLKSTDTENTLGYEFLRGFQYQTRGEFDKAKKCYQKVLKSQPDRIDVYYQLSQMKGLIGEEEKAVKHLQKLIKTKNLDEKNKVMALFTLASLLDSQKKSDEAFTAYNQANAIIATKESTVLEEFKELAKESLEAFTPDIIKRMRPSGHETNKPIFILGFMRSGTTLVESIVSRHSRVFAAGELMKMPNISQTLRDIKSEHFNYPKDLEKLEPDTLYSFGTEYLNFIDNLNTDNLNRVTDKLPGNFMRVGLISILFPNAKIIHCKRDPIDTCVSNYMQKFSTKNLSALASSLESLGQFYCLYHKLMQHWKAVVPHMILDVQYENLVSEPEAMTREMLSHLDLPWEDACLDHQGRETTVSTASQWQVRQPIYKSSVQKWKKYEKHLGPLITELKKDPGISEIIN